MNTTPTTPLRVIGNTLLVALVAMAIVVILVIGIVIVHFAITGFEPQQSLGVTDFPPKFLMGLLLAVEIPLLGVALFVRWWHRRKFGSLEKLFEYAKPKAILAGVAAGAILAPLGGLNAYFAERFFGHAATPEMEAMMKGLLAVRDHPGIAIAGTFIIGVVAPVCEEMFFRAALFAGSASRGQAWTGAIASSLLFMLAHVNGVMSFYYVVVGLAMCGLYLKTRTLAAPIAAHMTVNLSACIITMLS